MSGLKAPSAPTISCPIERRAFIKSAVMPPVPMSLATDIIRCPSRNASCERISQQPMCPDTVTAGRFAARNAFTRADTTPVSAHFRRAPHIVQNAYPTVRAMLRYDRRMIFSSRAVGLYAALSGL